MEEYALDVLRMDYNVDPGEMDTGCPYRTCCISLHCLERATGPIWQANDKDDRSGLVEVAYIDGLYTLWDTILSRHPGLLIDDCSSGGRRIDIETLARSFPLWRSDNAGSAAAPGAVILQIRKLCNAYTFSLHRCTAGSTT